MIKDVRVRFAPSPTGHLHVGGARSALFNWLFARHTGGAFLLRIEDTDRSRYNPIALEQLLEDLRWLGLTWDEGPGVGGPHGSYVQSERRELHVGAAVELVERGHAYRCFCTPERLEELRTRQEKLGLPPGYDRHCRGIDPHQSDDLAQAKEPFVVRFKAPTTGTTVFHDRLRGRIETQNHVLDDWVLLKTDGFPTYHLANVVDDHDMRITHVLRGDEWIPSTPRHVLQYEAFGWTAPEFVHLPVILAPGGGKLSKRHGAVSVGEYRQSGYLPEAMFNFLSLLGWNPGDEREIMSIPEIVETFDIDRILPKSAAFDEVKLTWMNGQHLQRRDPESLREDVASHLARHGLAEAVAADPNRLDLHIRLLAERSRRLDELAETGLWLWRAPETFDEAGLRKHWTPEGVERLRQAADALQTVSPFDVPTLDSLYRRLSEEGGFKLGLLVHPTRLACSGITFGPGLFDLMAALGRDTCLARIRHALDTLPVVEKRQADHSTGL